MLTEGGNHVSTEARAVLPLISAEPFIPLGKALDGVLQGDGCLSCQPPRQLRVSPCRAESSVQQELEHPIQPWAVAVGWGHVSCLAGTACRGTGQSVAARSLSWDSSLWLTVWGAPKYSWSQQNPLPAC